jgi:glycosyltransferase involved in cell wall biosynthesis
VGHCQQDWYDAVIPNYFDPDDFTFQDKKQDYFLFLGRVYSGKGIDIAVQATERTGQRLIIAGQGTLREMGYSRTPDHVTEVGYADIARRRELMRDARGAIIASQYLEPFGGVQVENLFSGTPTVTTDWGAFTENNIPGVTGYRCRDMSQFEWAIRNIDQIQPAVCRDYAVNNFSMAAVAPRYEEYFEQVQAVYQGQGWYESHAHTDIRVPHRWLPR